MLVLRPLEQMLRAKKSGLLLGVLLLQVDVRIVVQPKLQLGRLVRNLLRLQLRERKLRSVAVVARLEAVRCIR